LEYDRQDNRPPPSAGWGRPDGTTEEADLSVFDVEPVSSVREREPRAALDEDLISLL
jgi:hypothetical protein